MCMHACVRARDPARGYTHALQLATAPANVYHPLVSTDFGRLHQSSYTYLFLFFPVVLVGSGHTIVGPHSEHSTAQASSKALARALLAQ